MENSSFPSIKVSLPGEFACLEGKGDAKLRDLNSMSGAQVIQYHVENVL